MKKIVFALVFIISFGLHAQKSHKAEKRNELFSEMSPKQIATLKTKKMTLALELTDAQQKKIMVLNEQQAIVRKASMEERKAKKDQKKKPSTKEIYDNKVKQLDQQIAFQRALKKILDTDQYDQWKAMKKNKRKKKQRRKRSRRAKK